MTHIGLIVFIVFSYEIFIFLKLFKLLKLNLLIYKKLYLTFSKKSLSDKKKEFLILNFSKKLLILSLKIILTLIAISTLFYFFNRIFTGLYAYLTSMYGILFSSIILYIYIKIRKFI